MNPPVIFRKVSLPTSEKFRKGNDKVLPTFSPVQIVSGGSDAFMCREPEIGVIATISKVKKKTLSDLAVSQDNSDG
ncbi:MAG: hypothetical protein WCA04_16090 [Geobacteraceae bacterium]